jgi:TonB family protein
MDFMPAAVRVLQVLLAMVAASAAADDSALSGDFELIGTVGAAARECRRLHDPNSYIDDSVVADITVDPQGQPTGVVFPEGARGTLEQLALCTAIKLRFKPVVRDGVARGGSTRMTLSFQLPPSIKRYDGGLAYRCSRKALPDPDIAARFVIEVTISDTGWVLGHQMPPDAEPWMDKMAGCVLKALEFNPARRNSRPVEATVTIPIVTGPEGIRTSLREIVRPRPGSTDDEILDAYRKCYPPGMTAEARVSYRITVSTLGRVLRTEVIEGSGNARLDEAGACILKELRFEPATVDGVLIQTTIGWPLLVRPPPSGT